MRETWDFHSRKNSDNYSSNSRYVCVKMVGSGDQILITFIPNVSSEERGYWCIWDHSLTICVDPLSLTSYSSWALLLCVYSNYIFLKTVSGISPQCVKQETGRWCDLLTQNICSQRFGHKSSVLLLIRLCPLFFLNRKQWKTRGQKWVALFSLIHCTYNVNQSVCVVVDFHCRKTYSAFCNMLWMSWINGKSREVMLLVATLKKSFCVPVRQKVESLMNVGFAWTESNSELPVYVCWRSLTRKSHFDFAQSSNSGCNARSG